MWKDTEQGKVYAKNYAKEYYLKNKNKWKESEKRKKQNPNYLENKRKRERELASTPKAKAKKKEYFNKIKNTPEFKEWLKNYRYKYRYGVSTEDKKNMLVQQNYMCAFQSCLKVLTFSSAHLDHNHVTGQVRGLLCHNHNSLLGMAKDDLNTLKDAISYLEKWK